MPRNIIVTVSHEPPVEKQAVEMCEHKGIGHPDSLTDGICEAASRELSRAYLKECGGVLHHNLDKGLLVSGISAPRFGGGKLLRPMKVIICGKATPLKGRINPSEIAAHAARRYLEENIRCEVRHFEITTEIKEGSDSLKAVFARHNRVPLANDTSFGIGYAPYSRLESAVLDLSRLLRSTGFRKQFPAAGDDFKIMGYRVNGTLRFIVALAFIDRHVENVAHYFSIKRAICEYLGVHASIPGDIQINTSDNPAARDESELYLTVLGLSAEMGDDGQVGRGNRVNGLISPGRAMSLEAVAGKNPTSHIGKIYNVMAFLMAQEIVKTVEDVTDVKVQLLSAIGKPVGEPEVAAIEVRTAHGLSERLNREIAAIAEHWLVSTNRVTEIILDGEGAPCRRFIDRHSTQGT